MIHQQPGGEGDPKQYNCAQPALKPQVHSKIPPRASVCDVTLDQRKDKSIQVLEHVIPQLCLGLTTKMTNQEALAQNACFRNVAAIPITRNGFRGWLPDSTPRLTSGVETGMGRSSRPSWEGTPGPL